MISVAVSKQGSYPVNSVKIKRAVIEALRENGIVSDTEVSVAVVDDKKMVDLGFGGHPVLAFPASEVKSEFVFPPDGKIHLGEILISYDWVKNEANKKGRLIDDIVGELAEHASLHLMGIHHE